MLHHVSHMHVTHGVYIILFVMVCILGHVDCGCTRVYVGAVSSH